MTTSYIQAPSTTDPPVSPGPDSVVSARVPLRMRMAGGRPSALDGAWWPQTRNLQVELADLVDHFPPDIGRVDRAVISPPDWLPAARRIQIARGFLKVGSFPRDDTHVVLLRMSTGEVLTVLVVPPTTSASQADQIMRAATSAGNQLAGQAIFDMAAARGQFGDDASADHWDDDGGASAHPEPRVRAAYAGR